MQIFYGSNDFFFLAIQAVLQGCGFLPHEQESSNYNVKFVNFTAEQQFYFLHSY